MTVTPTLRQPLRPTSPRQPRPHARPRARPPLRLLTSGSGDGTDDSGGKARAAPAPARGASGTGLAGLRVLVVEDEVLIAMEIEDLLQSLGAEVVGLAMEAGEALRLAESLRPDCLTMDVRLLGATDGVAAATEVYRRLGIRSVFVSAHGDDATRARAEGANPVGWLQKPITRAGLEAALRRLHDGDANRSG